MKPSSLIKGFIKQKREAYTEPVYLGSTPEGLSEKKFTTSLFTALTNFPLETIAKKLSISHGLIRKWRTEDPFKKAELEHLVEFLDFFVHKTKEILEEWTRLVGSGSSIQKGEEGFQALIDDYGKYSPRLQALILDEFLNTILPAEPALSLFAYQLGMALLSSQVKGRKKKELVEKLNNRLIKFQQEQVIAGLDRIIEALEKPKLRAIEKRVMTSSLKNLREILNVLVSIRK